MRKLSRATLLMGVLAVAASSCSDDNGVTNPPNPTPTTVAIISGNEQILAAGEESEPLVVEVRNQNGGRMGGVTVTFAGSGAEHTLSSPSAVSNGEGRVQVTVTAGDEAGEIEVQATVASLSPAVFTLTVGAGGQATSLVKVSGDEQSLNFDEESEPLVVEVRDQNDDPMEGVTVTFTGSGVGHSLSAGSSTTGANGRAQITVTAGAEEGDIEIVAAVDGLEAVRFTATVEFAPSPTTINKVSGDEQELEYNEESEALVVEVLDQNDEPMEGVTVTFTGSGPAHTLSAASATTYADGRAEIVVTAGSEPGEIEVEAKAGSAAAVFTVTVEDAPFSLVAPDIKPRGLAWDGTHLWVVAGPDDFVKPTIYRLDPRDGSVLQSFTAPAAGHRDLAWDGENLWYSAHGTRSIYKLNPSDGSVLLSFRSPRGNDGQPRGLAWDGTHLWHTDAGGPNRLVFRLSAEDGEVLESFASPVTLPVALEWDGTHLWTSQVSAPTDLVRFDRDGNIVSRMASPGEATVGLAYDAAGSWMWASDFSTAEDEIVLIRRIRVNLDP
jgi:hypothetical protein